jgi:hypothetical protein
VTATTRVQHAACAAATEASHRSRSMPIGAAVRQRLPPLPVLMLHQASHFPHSTCTVPHGCVDATASERPPAFNTHSAGAVLPRTTLVACTPTFGPIGRLRLHPHADVAGCASTPLAMCRDPTQARHRATWEMTYISPTRIITRCPYTPRSHHAAPNFARPHRLQCFPCRQRLPGPRALQCPPCNSMARWGTTRRGIIE